MVVGAEPKYSPSKIMQNIKSIGARQIFIGHLLIKKQLVCGELSRDGGYIRKLEGETTSDIIKIYVENKGSKEKHIIK
jgi:putative transposase